MSQDADTSPQAAADQTAADVERLTHQVEHLEKAVQSNRRIGMAMGILMARRGLTEVEAFHCLVQASQQQNRKLAAIAEDVIYIGHL
jgi:AmiR/NasT family two-component response regulator